MKNSKFELLIEQLEQIPSIGKKSALKIAYSLAIENKVLALNIAHCIEDAVNCVQKCEICGGISESRICNICEDESRLFSGMLCIVGSPKDILTIEDAHIFEGVYLVVDGTQNIDFKDIIANINLYNIKEIIFAFTPTLASDAMILYIEDKLKDLNLRFSKIAQGVPTGVGLDNIDKLSLTRALESRIRI
ncbi:recombination protein RecR [Helicobacter sp. 16-1353]|uniref:recombination mediator RecR n=1 Tax=Helicobacter sp. 16-1353 TaxID=2004996 RepID=UPI000DCE578B|nr:recombination mediator RecR [Helicobacter sp. 16-1353]RAX52079.1 recombination protein RecR [Helicobacter sp. 16-1353]